MSPLSLAVSFALLALPASGDTASDQANPESRDMVGVQGFVYLADGVTPVERYTPCTIVDLTNGATLEAMTGYPFVLPQHYYEVTFSAANVGDLVRVDSFNLTHRGSSEVITVVLGSGNFADIILDQPRDNEIPEITSTPVVVAEEDAVYAYDVEAYDLEEYYGLDTLTYGLSVHPPGMTIDPATGLIEWLPTNADVGPHDVTVYVIDWADATDTQSFWIDVAPVNDPPQITSTPVPDAIVDLPYAYDVDAVDADNENGVTYDDDVVTYSLVTFPAGMQIDPATGVITWVPGQADLGPHDVVVSASDGTESDEQPYTLQVHTDCNGNGIGDGIDIAGGTSQDCDGNGMPDECEPDTDGDGLIDGCDADRDNDGVDNAADPDPLDPNVCGDVDGDSCDDCAVGTDGFGPLPDNDPDNDGVDTDADGLCDAGDPDDDNDCVLDDDDADPLDPFWCEDVDQDGCDDCSVGNDGFGPLCDNRPAVDGLDADADGVCDAFDNCSLYNPAQTDCQPNGVGDVCDLADGTSSDCDANQVPDECDPDEDGDGIPDACDSQMPLCEDYAGLTCEQDADCDPPGVVCVEGVCYVRKNRYISIDPNPANAAKQTARRVSLYDLGGQNLVLGWVGEPIEVLITGPETSPQLLSRIEDAPHYRDWGVNDQGGPWLDPTVHVGDCETSPGRTFVVQSIVAGADIGDESRYSPPLMLRTIDAFGDVVGASPGAAPDGVRNFKDISAVVRGFQSVQTESKVWLDLYGSSATPEIPFFPGINFFDINAAVGGFQGAAYPFAAPCDCPGQDCQ